MRNRIGKGRLFIVHFILFEFWTMWLYYSFVKLKGRKRHTRDTLGRCEKEEEEGVVKREERQNCLGDSNPFQKAVRNWGHCICQRPFLAFSTAGTGWTSHRLFVGQRQSHFRSKCFLFFPLTEMGGALPHLHSTLQKSLPFQNLPPSPKTLKSHLYPTWGDVSTKWEILW